MRVVCQLRIPMTSAASKIKKIVKGRSRKIFGPSLWRRKAWRNARSAPGPRIIAIINAGKPRGFFCYWDRAQGRSDRGLAPGLGSRLLGRHQ